MRRALLLCLMSCRFDSALSSYCGTSAQCSCDAGACCVKAGFTCNDGAPCCSGSCTGGLCNSGAAGGSGGGSAGGTVADPLAVGEPFPVPLCTSPQPAGSLANFAGCCTDLECASGQCNGFPGAPPGGRRCVPVISAFAELGHSCGDENDCQPAQNLACGTPDGGFPRCVARFRGTLGEGAFCTPQTRLPNAHACNFAPAGVCGLPGTQVGPIVRNWPCCYDRWPDGGVADCRSSGSCSCNPDSGVCGAVSDYVCPL